MKQVKVNTVFSAEADRVAFAVTIANLINKGFDQKFRREPTCIFCFGPSEWFSPAEFTVNERYEIGSSFGSESERLVYAITTNSGIRGILVDNDGVYTDNISREMFRKLIENRNVTQ